MKTYLISTFIILLSFSSINSRCQNYEKLVNRSECNENECEYDSQNGICSGNDSIGGDCGAYNVMEYCLEYSGCSWTGSGYCIGDNPITCNLGIAYYDECSDNYCPAYDSRTFLSK